MYLLTYLLTDLSIFRENGKKFVPSESRIAFCRLFIVRVKKVCYERKVRGELLGCFFHCTLECLCPYVPTTSFRLMALRNKVECQCYNETNIPPCSFKNTRKFNFMSSLIDFIQYKFDHWKQYFIRENRSLKTL